MRWFLASVAGGFTALIMTIVASALLIAMGLVYFLITLWIIKLSAAWMGYTPDGNFAVLSASLIATGTMVISSLRK